MSEIKPTIIQNQSDSKLAQWWHGLSPTARTGIGIAGLMVIAMTVVKLGQTPQVQPPKVEPNATQSRSDLIVADPRNDTDPGSLSVRIEAQKQEVEVLKRELAQVLAVMANKEGSNAPFMSDQIAKALEELRAEVNDLRRAQAASSAPSTNATLPPTLSSPLPPTTSTIPTSPPAEPQKPTLRVIGTEKKTQPTAPDGTKELPKDFLDTLMAGGMVEGVLITGMDAPTSSVTRQNPVPALIRLKTDAFLPNMYKAGLRECFVIASGYGVMSTERADMRTEVLSCVREDGTPLEAKLDGYIVGEDGKAGLRGRVVSKQGQVMANALIAGVLEGLSKSQVSQPVPQLNINPGVNPTMQTPNSSNLLRDAGLGGFSSATSQIAAFYLRMANEIFPVVEIDPGRRVAIVALKSVPLGPSSFR